MAPIGGDETVAEMTGPSVSLDLPDVWEPIPLEPDEYVAWLGRTLALQDLPADQARAVEVAFRSALVEARGEGLLLAAGFVGGVEDPNGDVQVLAAAAFAAAKPAGELEGKLSSVAWLAALSDAERTGDLDLLEPPEIVMLGEHEAVRALVLEELAADASGPEMAIFGVTYYLTVADGAAMLVLGFRTPCVWMAGEFEALFADIASTLVIEG